MTTPTTSTATGVTETVRLSAGDLSNPGDARSVRALLFGAMLQRAAPVLKHYRSDLYHDALWVDDHITDAMTWTWLVRECGTNLGDDADLRVEAGVGAEAAYYRLTFAEVRHCWQVTFETLPTGKSGR